MWRIAPDGTVTLALDTMGTANGIEVSPDGKTLYVNESVQRNIWAYDIGADGALSGKRLFQPSTILAWTACASTWTATCT